MNPPKPRRSLSFLLALAIVFVPGLAVLGVLATNQLGYCFDEILPGGGGLNARPYLLGVTPDSATLRFRTTVATDASVTYAADAGPQQSFDIPAAEIHTLELSDLHPGTVYTYTVEQGENRWDGTFRTPAGGTDTVRFDVLGSSGVASEAQHAIADQLLADAPDFVLHTGDVVFPRGALCHYGLRYFGPYEDLVGTSPIIPAPGEIDLNADGGRAFRETFGLAADPTEQAALYHAFDYGPVHVVVLDSERYEQGDRAGIEAQREWLASELQQTTSSWTVVVIHRPSMSSTSGAASEEIATDLGPLFADLGVDLVLSGHARNYERFQPDDGVTYVVTGGGGAGLQALSSKRESVAAASVHHFLSIEASPERFDVRVIDDKGAVIDTFGFGQ